METASKTCKSCSKVYAQDKDFLEGTSQWRLCSAENLWFNCTCGSTLMIPKGKFPWYSPTLGMSHEAASLFNRLKDFDSIPHIPSAIMEIQQKLQSDDVDNAELAILVRRAPLLASILLGLAENLKSIRGGDQRPLKSLEHAIVYIGKKGLVDLVLATSIKGFSLPTLVFSQNDFWEHSFLLAAVSESIAVKFKLSVQKDQAYLAGCLANIGKIVAAILYPKAMDEIWEAIHNVKTMSTWEQAELKLNIPSHCILGEIGAAIWGMPNFVARTARHHHRLVNPQKSCPNDIINIAALANMLTHWIRLEPSRIDTRILCSLCKVYNLTEKDLEALVKELMPLREKIA